MKKSPKIVHNRCTFLESLIKNKKQEKSKMDEKCQILFQQNSKVKVVDKKYEKLSQLS